MEWNRNFYISNRMGFCRTFRLTFATHDFKYVTGTARIRTGGHPMCMAYWTQIALILDVDFTIAQNLCNVRIVLKDCKHDLTTILWLNQIITISKLHLKWKLSILQPLSWNMHLRGAMGEILFKNYFFILLHKFNLHNLIYDFLKFQTSVTDVQSFIRPYINFYAI